METWCRKNILVNIFTFTQLFLSPFAFLSIYKFPMEIPRLRQLNRCNIYILMLGGYHLLVQFTLHSAYKFPFALRQESLPSVVLSWQMKDTVQFERQNRRNIVVIYFWMFEQPYIPKNVLRLYLRITLIWHKRIHELFYRFFLRANWLFFSSMQKLQFCASALIFSSFFWCSSLFLPCYLSLTFLWAPNSLLYHILQILKVAMFSWLK